MARFNKLLEHRPPSTSPKRLAFIVVEVKFLARLLQQVAQLSQRDRAAGWVSLGGKLKTVMGDDTL